MLSKCSTRGDSEDRHAQTRKYRKREIHPGFEIQCRLYRKQEHHWLRKNYLYLHKTYCWHFRNDSKEMGINCWALSEFCFAIVVVQAQDICIQPGYQIAYWHQTIILVSPPPSNWMKRWVQGLLPTTLKSNRWVHIFQNFSSQWRIQDFPEGGANPRRGCANLLFCK